jgi:hypothetical protein
MNPGPLLGGTEFIFAGKACFAGGHFTQLSKEQLLLRETYTNLRPQNY